MKRTDQKVLLSSFYTFHSIVLFFFVFELIDCLSTFLFFTTIFCLCLLACLRLIRLAYHYLFSSILLRGRWTIAFQSDHDFFTGSCQNNHSISRTSKLDSRIMSPPPSVYLHPERERERRRTRTRTHHDIPANSPSTATTLRPPPDNLSVDSLGKPQPAAQTQHRSHRIRHSRPSSQSIHHTSNQSPSRTRSSEAFPSTTTLPSAPTRFPPSPPYSVSSPATHSRASTLISSYAPPIALEFLNFLDDLGILVLCKPLLELCNVEWIPLFDDMGIFYLCEPIGAIRRILRKLKIRRADRDKGLEVLWRARNSRNSKKGSKRHSTGEERSRRSEDEDTKVPRTTEKEVDESVSGIGTERISGANRRRSERAASSVAASGLGQGWRGAPRAKL
ncbi:hypothetical protein EYC84_008540 [Monilinia fructicola]|uniref:Uncharacterized protein n=1 Tax=Monilinia fructicola TaxID=38448 RepID=A0A5M9JFQ1_MONFR|nr:hypothetical protein EYC84_008540 [Monilinia fructicola]